MCAPHELPMPLSRTTSHSTSGRTLIGSDNGMYSPWDNVPNPIMQTPDQRQWIDLELLNPKFLKGLSQYAPSAKDEPNSKLGKGAAKIKAWARQSKAGIDIRLRRKINAEKDEITEIHLVPDSYNPDFAIGLEKPPMPSELPASRSIAELADTAPTTELDATEENTEPSQPSRSSTTSTLGEPLPRYERESGTSTADINSSAGDPQPSTAFPSVTNDDANRDVSPMRSTETSHRPSTSQSSIVATPKRGLSIRDDADFQAAASDTKEESDHQTTLKADLDDAKKKLEEERTLSESLQAIIQALSEEQSQPRKSEEELSLSLPKTPAKRAERNRLKVANRMTYETETEHEVASPLPRRRRQIAGPSRRKKSVTFPKQTQRAPSPRNVRSATSDVSDSEPDAATSNLIRKQTLPKRVPSTAGAKAIWRSLIHTQTILLGPDNHLTIRAKSDFRTVRAGKFAVQPAKLEALQESKLIATRDFGSDHPWVAAFCEDLERLEQSMLMPSQNTQSSSHANTSPPPTSPNVRGSPVDQARAAKSDPHTPEVVVTGAPAVRSTVADAPLQLDTNVPAATSEKEPSPVVGGVEIDSQLDMLWNNRGLPHQPRGTHTAFLRLGIAALSKVAWNGIMWVQRNYGPEQPVEAGKTRVRWTCSCGEKLHDDFIEKRPGAARALEAYLNRPKGIRHTLKPETHTQHPNGSSPTTSGSSPGGRSWNSSFNAPPSSQTSFSSNQFPNTGSWPADSDPKTWTNTTPSHLPFSPTYEPPWLLTCATEDRLTPKVTHLDMSRHKIHSDKDLANSLRDHYFNVNKKWWKGLRLRGLISIEFAQFELHQNRFADIRKVPDVPLSGRQDYNFEPSDLLPPVGSHYLLHLFRHPEDYDGELITYLRSPKRNGRLQLGVGWGINLVEGFLADKVWIWMSAMFALGSLVFGIVYAIMKKDLQGAFGVAAWIVTLGGLGAGWVQACIG